ncbi:hypothetical protein C8J56DRAFT_1120765 [Mycena floridula]|nr:hypothetical protein C8J56DRAFT_1120765 [Mycena floridula]
MAEKREKPKRPRVLPASQPQPSTMSKQIVLVTGGTGYVGSHIISQLLAQNRYTVRATARPGKVVKIRSIFPDAGDDLQITEVESLTADHTAALHGVTAIIHCASSGFRRIKNGQETFDGAYHGSIHLVKSAITAGIKKIVVTGTYASLFDADFKAAFGTDILNANSWGSVTLEGVNTETDDRMTLYQVGKMLSEKKIWELAHENPDVDVTVVLPSVIFGPYVKGFPISELENQRDLGTIDFLYSLITGGPGGPNTYPAVPVGHMVDVRDVAKAHVKSLDVPPLRNGKDKRLIIMSKVFTWKELAQFLRQKRPELASRLPNEEAVSGPQTSAPLNIDLAKEVLGLSTYIPWGETVLATIDEGLRWENRKLNWTRRLHVISQLLAQKQYTVRATARPGKASKIRSIFPEAGDNLQVVVVESLTADHTAALLGITAIIHCASPGFRQNEKGEDTFNGSYHGSIHIVKAAISAGVKKIIVAGTFSSLFDGEFFPLEVIFQLRNLPLADFKAAFGTDILNANSWGSTTLESAKPETDNLMAVYQAGKMLPERKIWEFAHESPDVDVTVVLPPAIFGPFTARTVNFVYTLITGTYPPVSVGHMVDVRDVAKALVKSLDAPPLKNGRDKRLLIMGNIMGKFFTWKKLAQLLREKRPELASRLRNEEAVLGPQTSAPLDINLAKEVLGLSTYIPWEGTVLDTIDEGLRWENQ